MQPVAIRCAAKLCPHSWPWILLGAMTLVMLGALWMAQVTVNLTQFSGMALWLGAMAGLRQMREQIGSEHVRRVIDFLEVFALSCAIALVGAVTSFATAALSTSYSDVLLDRMDRAIGFDWGAAYRLTFSNWWVRFASMQAYGSIFITPTLVLALLSATDRADRARRFACAYGLALGVTVIAMVWVSAAGPLSFYGYADDGSVTATGFRHIEVIDALRAGRLQVVDLTRLEGLVSVPSFHAASALLFVWAAWPLKRARWPILTVNLAMLAATPVDGNHYVVDLLAGLAIAAAAVWVVEAAVKRRGANEAPDFAIVAPPMMAVATKTRDELRERPPFAFDVR